MVDKSQPPAISMVMSDDISDVPAALAGDRDALARLYERHAPIILSLCRRCGTPAEADDALQEVFLRAFNRLGQLARPAGFRPWLYSIARRVCSERRRSGRRRTRHETEATMRHAELETKASNPADTAEQAEQLDRLTAALDLLPEDERLVIHFHYLDPDPPEAARCALGLSRSGYYKLLHRARQRLAGLLKEARTS
jgi:RNA polymerase sigma-70 factor (ECF subfamily)